MGGRKNDMKKKTKRRKNGALQGREKKKVRVIEERETVIVEVLNRDRGPKVERQEKER